MLSQKVEQAADELAQALRAAIDGLDKIGDERPLTGAERELVANLRNAVDEWDRRP
jgi:hypothetical protein